MIDHRHGDKAKRGDATGLARKIVHLTNVQAAADVFARGRAQVWAEEQGVQKMRSSTHGQLGARQKPAWAGWSYACTCTSLFWVLGFRSLESLTGPLPLSLMYS